MVLVLRAVPGSVALESSGAAADAEGFLLSAAPRRNQKTPEHLVLQSSGADAIYPRLKAFSRFAQDVVTDVRGPAQWQGYYGCLAVSELGLEVLHKELLDERKREAYVGQ